MSEEFDAKLDALLEKHTAKRHPVRDYPERLAIVRRVLEHLAARRIRLAMPKIHAICVEYAGEDGTWCGDTAWRKFLADEFPELLARVRVS